MRSILLLSITILACWAAEAPKLPTDVQTVIDKAEAAKAKIDQTLIKDLTKLQETYTKKGNLDAANGIKAKVDEVTKGLPDVLTDTAVPVTDKSAIGTWKMKAGFTVVLNQNKTAAWKDESHALAGSWAVEGKTIVVRWQNGIVYKFTAVSEKTIAGAEMTNDVIINTLSGDRQ